MLVTPRSTTQDITETFMISSLSLVTPPLVPTGPTRRMRIQVRITHMKYEVKIQILNHHKLLVTNSHLYYHLQPKL